MKEEVPYEIQVCVLGLLSSGSLSNQEAAETLLSICVWGLVNEGTDAL